MSEVRVLREVTREEFHKAINIVDCVHAPESRIQKSVWMERRSGKRVGEVLSTSTAKAIYRYFLYN